MQILTANSNMTSYLNHNYTANTTTTTTTASMQQNDENKENEDVQPKIEQKKKAGWDCPVVEYIEQSVFDQLNRHQRGSLKFDNLTQATDEINEIIKQKYALLNKVKGKSRLAKKYPDVERYYADMADQAGFAFAISEADLAGASFIKLKHKKEAIIRTLKSEGRIQEKRRAKKPSLYCLISPITKQLV